MNIAEPLLWQKMFYHLPKTISILGKCEVVILQKRKKKKEKKKKEGRDKEPTTQEKNKKETNGGNRSFLRDQQ